MENSMKMRAHRFALPIVLALPLTYAAAFAQSPDDFIKDAVKGNIAEVKLGKLAQQRGSTEAVRSFGKMLADDHSKAASDAVSVAKEMNVNAPQQPSAEGDKFYEKAMQMNGKAFDAAFASYMVDDHQKDIKEYTEQAQDKKNTAVAAYAEKSLPVLKKHLETAQQIQKQER
jgi:putative membrane protein